MSCECCLFPIANDPCYCPPATHIGWCHSCFATCDRPISVEEFDE